MHEYKTLVGLLCILLISLFAIGFVVARCVRPGSMDRSFDDLDHPRKAVRQALHRFRNISRMVSFVALWFVLPSVIYEVLVLNGLVNRHSVRSIWNLQAHGAALLLLVAQVALAVDANIRVMRLEKLQRELKEKKHSFWSSEMEEVACFSSSNAVLVPDFGKSKKKWAVGSYVQREEAYRANAVVSFQAIAWMSNSPSLMSASIRMQIERIRIVAAVHQMCVPIAVIALAQGSL